MSVGTKTECVTVTENMMSLLRISLLGSVILAATAVALTPTSVLAEKEKIVPVAGTFAVAFMRPSAVDYCAIEGIPGGTAIAAQGIGNISELGPLFLTVKKCSVTVGNAVTYVGTFKMTDGNGDTMEGTYAGTADRALRDENGFGPFQGTLTLSGGTGKFRDMTSGILSFTAVGSPVSVGVTSPTGNAMAFYLVRGAMSSRDEK